MILYLDTYQGQVDEICNFASQYDSVILPSPGCPQQRVKANGFRSFIRVARCFIDMVVARLSSVKGPALGPKDRSDLAAYNSCLESLIEINRHLLELHELAVARRDAAGGGGLGLFPEAPDVKDPRVEELARRIAATDLAPFYGAACGFHYRGADFAPVCPRIVASVAAYADVFQPGREPASLASRARRVVHGLLKLGRYSLYDDPGELARKVQGEIRSKPIEFCKSFYDLAEADLLHPPVLDLLVPCHGSNRRIKTNFVFRIPTDRMTIPNTEGGVALASLPRGNIGNILPPQVQSSRFPYPPLPTATASRASKPDSLPTSAPPPWSAPANAPATPFPCT